MTKEKIIIDTDLGDFIDDYLALILAILSPEIEIIGITTVYKNCEARAKMVTHLLKQFGVTTIPVFPGISYPLQNNDLNINELPRLFKQEVKQEDVTHVQAIDFLESTLLNSLEPITLVAIGPLTNIATLLLKNHDVVKNIKRIVLMGGAYNLNCSELNILNDPEAAKIVFEEGIEIVAFGIDVTRTCQMKKEDIVRIEQHNNYLFQLLNHFISSVGHYPSLHDPLPIAYLIDPTLVKLEYKRIGIETKGEFTRGMTFNISNTRWWEKNISSHIQICTYVDKDRFIQLFLNRLL